ncbi:MAG: hypothetical protein V4750_14750 [Pseudomonadota bacterium]
MQFDVVDMAMSKATKFEHQHSVLVSLRPIAKAVFRAPAAVAILCAAWFVDKLAQNIAEKAIWFRGASAHLQEHRLEHQLDPEDKARAHLDNLEAELLEFRGNVMNVLEMRRRSRPVSKSRATPSLERLAAAVGDLYEEARAFKGVIQAHDADVCSAQVAPVALWSTESQVEEGIRTLSER